MNSKPTRRGLFASLLAALAALWFGRAAAAATPQPPPPSDPELAASGAPKPTCHDGSGRATTYVYDSCGRLTTVTDSGRVMTFTYDSCRGTGFSF
jgi:hypothetical protein